MLGLWVQYRKLQFRFTVTVKLHTNTRWRSNHSV